MKNILLSVLRDKHTTREAFRKASEQMSEILAMEAVSLLPTVGTKLETPIKETTGERLLSDQVIIPILRSGLAMLPAFLRYLPSAKVGFFGLKRDEVTFEAKLYYENLPEILPSNDILIIDPMLATGGSGKVALARLKEMGVDFSRIIFVGIVASPEGIAFLKKHAPGAKIVVGAIDEGLNAKKYIVPGLGDFGDRYFGTEP